MTKYAQILCNVFVFVLCASLFAACGGTTSPTAPTTPMPNPDPDPTSTTVTLTGVVRASDSNSHISGATIRILDGVNGGQVTTTNASGEYKFDGLAKGNANLSATASGYEESRAGVFVDGSNTLDFTLRPLPTTTIGGRVYDDANGKSISNVLIEVLGTELRATTDSEGRYRISGIRLETFTVRYSHSEYQTREQIHTLMLGSEPTDLNIGLTALTTTISGRVWGDCSGKVCLIEGAEVILLNSDGSNSDVRTTTNSEGRYRLSDIRTSPFKVRYRHPRFHAAVVEYFYSLGVTADNVDVGLGRRE